MLLSPVLCNHALSILVSADDGPHTALLASPHGQVVASASRKYEDEEGSSASAADSQTAGNGDVGGSSSSTGHALKSDAAHQSGAGVDSEHQGDEGVGDGEDEEPWLDEPERMRLLLGLASQWSTDESPRIECELGRLYIRTIPLPAPEALPANSGVPPVRNSYIPNFLLVLNGTVDTPWNILADLAESFEL